MAEQKDRLTKLLDYLVQHNEEHTRELKEIAEQAQAVIGDTVRNHMYEAVKALEECTESLSRALLELRE